MSYLSRLIVNCGHPGLVPRANNSLPRVEGYDDLPVRKGTNISFSCPPGKVLIGPSWATCTENGEWEPDLWLSDPMCKGNYCQFITLYDNNNILVYSGVAICKHPFLNISVGSSLYILNYTDLELAVVGTTVSFNCSKANEVLIGPNTTTCMDNGRWEPDPSQLQNLTSCKGNAWYCYYQYRG